MKHQNSATPVNNAGRTDQDNPMSAATRRSTHVAYLDGLRAIAALFVLLHHVWLNDSSRPLYSGAQTLTLRLTGFLGLGHFAVDLFIVLSGFCLSLPILKSHGTLVGGALQFYKRRAKRILPPYYAALAFSLILIATVIGHKTGTHWDVSLPVTKSGIVSHVLLAENIWKPAEINHVLWSVAVEWQIYFFFPLFLFLFRKTGMWTTAIATTAITIAMFQVGSRHFPQTSNFFEGINLPYYALFVYGMTAAYLAHPNEHSRQMPSRGLWKWLAICSALAIAFIVVAKGLTWVQWHAWLLDYLVGACAAASLISAAIDETSLLRRVCSWRPLVFIGTFAYSLYLIHAPLIQVIWQYLVRPMHISPDQGYWVLAFAGPLLIVPTAYLFFLLFEKPFLRRRLAETTAEIERDAALIPAP